MAVFRRSGGRAQGAFGFGPGVDGRGRGLSGRTSAYPSLVVRRLTHSEPTSPLLPRSVGRPRRRRHGAAGGPRCRYRLAGGPLTRVPVGRRSPDAGTGCPGDRAVGTGWLRDHVTALARLESAASAPVGRWSVSLHRSAGSPRRLRRLAGRPCGRRRSKGDRPAGDGPAEPLLPVAVAVGPVPRRVRPPPSFHSASAPARFLHPWVETDRSRFPPLIHPGADLPTCAFP